MKRLRVALSIGGMALFLAGVLLFFGAAHFGTAARDYTQRSGEEYALIEDNALLVRPEGGVYCLSGLNSAVNVYSGEGEFLYSLPVPDYQNGEAGMAMAGDTLIILDKLGNLYLYRDGVYLGRAEDDFEARAIRVYGGDDALRYSAAYPDDEYSYLPLFAEDGMLYVLRSDGAVLEYEDGTLTAEDGYGAVAGIADAQASVTDGEGGTYRFEGLSPRLVHVSPDGEKTVIAAATFGQWLTQQPFAALALAALGLALTALPRLGAGRKERPMLGEE